MKLMELMGLIPAASIAEQASPGPVAPPWTCQVRGPEILPRTRGAALDLPGTGTGNPAPDPPGKNHQFHQFHQAALLGRSRVREP